ncbi:hypothetical protein M5689_015435 [Euphorbia peplus]|nr:hypothetical protein M5689_015435 [Euphorbia peplus]
MKLDLLSNLVRKITGFRSRSIFTDGKAVFPSNSYSTKATPRRRTIRQWESSAAELYRRISPLGDRNLSVVPVLDQWVQEGRSVDHDGLTNIIKELRFFKRHRHALEDFSSSNVIEVL